MNLGLEDFRCPTYGFEALQRSSLPCIAGIGTFAGWELVKTKIHELAEFFNVVDEALYDDAVTEKEFRAIWEKGRALFQWSFTAKKGEA